MNIGELMVRYLTKHLNLRLSNWTSAPAKYKTTPTRATLVHPQFLGLASLRMSLWPQPHSRE